MGKIYFKHLYTPLLNPIKENKTGAGKKARM